MNPDEKKKFNFGTGEIDTEQWLLDIDAGLEGYYNTYGEYWGKERTAEVQKAMKDLVGRISSGDMQSRTANGTYNFGSQLYSSGRGKYTKWAYQTALGYLGNKGRALITPAPALEEKVNTNKNTYTPLTLIKRLNNTILRGSTELTLDDTWWGKASKDSRSRHLIDFLNAEAKYVKDSEEIGDVNDSYRDIGREGLSKLMSELASAILTNPNGQYLEQFNKIGIPTDLLNYTPKSSLVEVPKPKTTEEQIAAILEEEADKQKQVQLGWLQNKEKDTYYNYDTSFYDEAKLSLDKYHSAYRSYGENKNKKNGNEETGAGGGAVLGAAVGQIGPNGKIMNDTNYTAHLNETAEETKKFLTRLAEGWEDLFKDNEPALSFTEGENVFDYTPLGISYGLAKLMYLMQDNTGNNAFAYLDPRSYPINVGLDLYYIPGSYRKTGDVLLLDTYNKRLVRSNVTKYLQLLNSLGADVLYEKEGGIIKMGDGGQYDASRFLMPAPSLEPQLDPQLENYQQPALTTSEPPQIGAGNIATLTSLVGDMASLGLAYSKNPIAKKASRFTNVISGVVGAYGDAKNGTFGGHNYVDLGLRLGAALPGGSLLRGAQCREWFNKLSNFAYSNAALIAYGLNTLGADEKQAAKVAWRKVINGQFSSIDQNDLVQLGSTLNLLLGTATANKHRAISEVQQLSVAGRKAVSTAGNRVNVTAQEVKDLRGVKNPKVKRGKKLKQEIELRTTKGWPTSILRPIESQYKVKTWPYITPSSVDHAREANWSLNWWGSGRPSRSDYQWVKNQAKQSNGLLYYFEGEPNSRRKNDLDNNGERTNPPRELDLERNGGRLDIIRHLRGGILKYSPGGKTGINAGTGYNWYNNVFSGYKLHILDGIGTEGYVDWLNKMQGDHAQVYNTAGGPNNSWRETAYSNQSVKDYQTAYQTGFTGYDTNDPYNATGIGKAYNTLDHYDFSASKNRGTLEVNNGQFKGSPDGLYSQMTDDRRLLGREGDWTTEQLLEWDTALKAKGYKMELDPNDHYYRIKPIDTSKQNPTGDLASVEEKVKADIKDKETERKMDPTPIRKLRAPFDPQPLYMGARAGTALLANAWLYPRILERLPEPAYEDFIDRKLDTIGDYSALAFAGNHAADLRRILQLRLVSDLTLNIAADYETGRINTEGDARAKMLDDAKQAVTHEAALQMDLKDLEDNRNVAWNNRRLRYDFLRDRADVLNAWDKSTTDITTGLVNNLTQWGTGKYLEKKLAYDSAVQATLQSPEERAQEAMRTKYPELYNALLSTKATQAQLNQYSQLLAIELRKARQEWASDYYRIYGGKSTIAKMPKSEGRESKKSRSAKNGGTLELIKSLRR